MEKIDKEKILSMINDIKNELENNDCYDMGDVGNLIGIALGKYLKDKSDFIDGFKHGVSIIDGTHSKL